MSTKQLLVAIFGIGIFTVGMISLLFAAYTMYNSQLCAVKPEPIVVQRVSPTLAPSITASPSATISPTTAVRRMFLASPTPVRRVIVSPSISPVVSPTQ